MTRSSALFYSTQGCPYAFPTKRAGLAAQEFPKVERIDYPKTSVLLTKLRLYDRLLRCMLSNNLKPINSMSSPHTSTRLLNGILTSNSPHFDDPKYPRAKWVNKSAKDSTDDTILADLVRCCRQHVNFTRIPAV